MIDASEDPNSRVIRTSKSEWDVLTFQTTKIDGESLRIPCTCSANREALAGHAACAAMLSCICYALYAYMLSCLIHLIYIILGRNAIWYS